VRQSVDVIQVDKKQQQPILGEPTVVSDVAARSRPGVLVKAKPKIVTVHRWLALIAGIFLILQGLTGTLVVFRQELNRVIHPAAMKAAPASIQPLLSNVIRAAKAAVPGEIVSRVDYPRAQDDVYIVRLDGNGEAIATVDQRGIVMRAGSIWFWPVEAAYLIHQSLMSGASGQVAIGFVGMALAFLALSGLLYWWPVRGSLGKALEKTIRVKLTKGRAARELHRSLAIFCSLYFLLQAFTGLSMAWSAWSVPAVGAVFPVMRKEPKFVGTSCARPNSVDAGIASARVAMPGAIIKSVRFKPDGQVLTVYFQSPITYPSRIVDRVWVDTCNSHVIAAETRSGFGDLLLDWLQPIHSGEWLGSSGRLLSFGLAIALIFVGISGYILWLGRIVNRRRTRYGAH
jgi:uncharacterized iron-regulated membrane protein